MNKELRIVYILNNSSLYGANRSLLSFVEYLLSRQDKVLMILPEQGDIVGELEEKGIPYKIITYRGCVWYPGYVGLPFLVNILNFRKIVSAIKAFHPDIIHTNNSSHDIGILAAKWLHIPHVWHVREIMESNYHTRYIFPHLYRYLRRTSDATICVSEFILNYHRQKYPNGQMYAIYNPFDVAYYSIERTEFAPNENLTILMAGAFTEYKRQIDAVEALGILADRGICNVVLEFAGSGSEEYTKMLLDRAREKNVEDRVHILGFLQDLRKVRREADVALCCSIDEALPRVLVEGMMSELLVIGSRSGGNAELIGNYDERGLAYETCSGADLADKIEYAMIHKAECREKIVRAKQYALDNFEKTAEGKKIAAVYEDVLKSEK